MARSSATSAVLSSGRTVRLIDQLPVESSLLDAWRGSALAAGNLFATPEWLFEFLEHSPESRLVLIVAFEGDRPLGIVPLIKSGPVIRFPASAWGDCFAPLVFDGDEYTVRELWFDMLRAFEKLRPGQLMMLDNVDTTLTQLVRTRCFRDIAHPLPYLALEEGSWDEWFAARTANFRSEVRRKGRGVEREGLSFVQIRPDDDVAAAIRQHFVLHDRRRAMIGDASSLGSATARRFHEGLAQRMAEQGWLRLWFLRDQDRVAASWYGWSLGGRYAYYQAGFDPAWGRFSPGTLLLARTVEAAFAEGASEYDLLLGEEQYKNRFATGSREVQTIAIPASVTKQSVQTYLEFAARRAHHALPERVQSRTRRLLMATQHITRRSAPSER